MTRYQYPGSKRFSSTLGINPMQYESSGPLHDERDYRGPSRLLEMQNRGCRNRKALP
jgi:hypothetical protein